MSDLQGVKCAINILNFHNSIAAVKSPVIIMHAEDDLVIPYDLGLKVSTAIFNSSLPCTLHVVPEIAYPSGSKIRYIIIMNIVNLIFKIQVHVYVPVYTH